MTWLREKGGVLEDLYMVPLHLVFLGTLVHAAVRWALSRFEDANMPEVVHAVVLTLTENRKAAKQARKAAEQAVLRAERKLRRTYHGHGHAWLAAGLLAAAAAAGVLIWRDRTREPEAAQPGDLPTDAV